MSFLKRHNLPLINLINKDGTLNDEVPAPYRGLSREAARRKIVADLESAGLLDFLFDRSARPDFTHRHRWEKGDLVMWDNRSLLHYAIHRGRMPTRLGRYLRQYHLAHHYASPERHFGVSSPLWDVVFRTR